MERIRRGVSSRAIVDIRYARGVGEDFNLRFSFLGRILSFWGDVGSFRKGILIFTASGLSFKQKESKSLSQALTSMLFPRFLIRGKRCCVENLSVFSLSKASVFSIVISLLIFVITLNYY